MTAALGILLAAAGGIPLAPPLQTRVIALVVVEAFLVTTAVLLYIRWVQLKEQPLDEWWAGRKAAGFSPRTRALMEESERERLIAEGRSDTRARPPDAPADPPDAPQSRPSRPSSRRRGDGGPPRPPGLPVSDAVPM